MSRIYLHDMAPKKGADEMREKIIPVSVTNKEHQEFHRLAKDEGIPLSILVRQLLRRRIEERKKGAAA